ncbi:O-fucosyltransferase 30 [Senna tora]|uniref:O-fucosyltransferase 30 n=1 Tax=Senna tora TaxID=362788 RepID=A0A834XJ71_9FABA|nr:O-fucosyltransferase 30 [Senna tora]
MKHQLSNEFCVSISASPSSHHKYFAGGCIECFCSVLCKLELCSFWFTVILPLIPVSILIILLPLLCFYYYYSLTSNSLYPVSSKSSKSQSPQCTSQALELREKFLWYAPHSGFSNQLSEFKNAILMAGILNRTLVVPPVLDHHAVVLGSCPKFRVVDPSEIRISVWDHAVELIRDGRYISIAEIIDISSLVSPPHIQAIDLRDFVSSWCSLSLNMACLHDLKLQPSFADSLKQCGSLLAGVHGSVDKCVYPISEDCRTTVWTYLSSDGDMMLDSFQPDEQLKKKKKLSYIRRRRDVLKNLGPGSEAESSSLVAFGSLFTAPYKGSQIYVDFHGTPQDQRFQSLMKKIEFLPFVPEITSAGKEFSSKTIKDPFLCAQLRLLDGQFKNHHKATFLGLKQKLEYLHQKGHLPINIFVMTDLPQDNWTETYLGDLIKDSLNYKIHFLREDDEVVKKAAKNLMAMDYRQRFIPNLNDRDGNMYCPNQRLPDVLLYVEQVVCSCASLGFVGTAGSTIAENIELMRKFSSGSCQS